MEITTAMIQHILLLLLIAAVSACITIYKRATDRKRHYQSDSERTIYKDHRFKHTLNEKVAHKTTIFSRRRENCH